MQWDRSRASRWDSVGREAYVALTAAIKPKFACMSKWPAQHPDVWPGAIADELDTLVAGWSDRMREYHR